MFVDPVLNILSTKNKKQSKTAFLRSLLPPQFHKEENIEVVKKERLPLSLQARLSFKKATFSQKKKPS